MIEKETPRTPSTQEQRGPKSDLEYEMDGLLSAIRTAELTGDKETAEALRKSYMKLLQEQLNTEKD